MSLKLHHLKGMIHYPVKLMENQKYKRDPITQTNHNNGTHCSQITV